MEPHENPAKCSTKPSTASLQSLPKPTASSRSKKKHEKSRPDPAARNSGFGNPQITAVKRHNPIKVKPIGVDKDASLQKSSIAPLQSPHHPLSPKRKKKHGKKSSKQAAEVPSIQGSQVTSRPAGRSEIAKNIARTFKAQQKHGIQRRSHKNASPKQNQFPFLRLPRELRDLIMEFTIDYNGVDLMLEQINKSFLYEDIRSSRSFLRKYQGWMSSLDARSICTTPKILLLNRQIHEEAQKILRKKVLRIAHPPQYPVPNQFDLARVISNGALYKIPKLRFELHTYPATERRQNTLQDDWKGHKVLKDECLADSYPWAMLLKHCFEIWRGLPQSRHLEISIEYCSGDRALYNLSLSGEKVRSHDDTLCIVDVC